VASNNLNRQGWEVLLFSKTVANASQVRPPKFVTVSSKGYYFFHKLITGKL